MTGIVICVVSNAPALCACPPIIWYILHMKYMPLFEIIIAKTDICLPNSYITCI